MVPLGGSWADFEGAGSYTTGKDTAWRKKRMMNRSPGYEKAPDGYIEPYDPEQIRPYQPGEGYATNAVPFAGVAAKSEGARGRQQALALLQRAREIGREIRDRRRRRAERPNLVEQTIPVPQGRLEHLGQKWFQDLSQELGCRVSISKDTEEAFGDEWQRVRLEGDEGPVREAQMRMIAALVPPVAGLA